MSAAAWELETAVPTTRRAHLRLVPDAASERVASRPVRLTRLGRLCVGVVVAAAVALIIAAMAYFGGSAAAQQQVTVERGQTLSEIAATQLPEMAIADGVVSLQVANNLSSAQVTAGQHLVIPR